MPTLEHLRITRDLTVGFLRGVEDRDWSAAVPDLEFDVRKLAAHMSQTNFWYSVDFAARGADIVAFVPEIKAESEPADLIASIDVGVELLATVVAAASAEARGFHPFGMADASGFAAMACDEMLLHTNDIARAFEIDFAPPAEQAQAVLDRLFPWIDRSGGDEDAWTLLRYANGRIALPDRPRLERWRWHCAPLTEWDGTPPS